MIMTVIVSVAVILGIIIVLGFVLPDKVTLKREAVINAPQADVFRLISDFAEWEKWSPWAKLDPDTEYTMAGEGVGQTMAWKSDNKNVGNGRQEIIAMSTPSTMTTALDFGEMGKAQATFTLSSSSDNATTVVWVFESNMRNGVPLHMKPMSTYMGFFMEKLLGPSYEEGLANMKEVAEEETAAAS